MNAMAHVRVYFQLIATCGSAVVRSAPHERAGPPGDALDGPCICPINKSLSRRSVPASRSSFAVRQARNFLLNPVNQPAQTGPSLEISERRGRGTAPSQEAV